MRCRPSLVLCLMLGLRSGTAPAATPQARTVTIRNDVPRRDVQGHIIDAHDGCLHFFNGRYYLYGTAYGRTAGYTINNRFRVYSSPDLVHWSFEGELLRSPPDGIYYRPYVAWNPHTRKYVLWYNWYPKLWDGRVGVAVSDTPVGPFTIVNTRVPVEGADQHPGDGSLFVDRDGAGYFIYSTIGLDHAIRIERLTPDFLSVTGQVSPILARQCEAPALFRRGDTYYALFDHTCCFCKQGSGARVLVASHPLGPWRQIANINESSGRPIVDAQQTFVAEIPTPHGTAYMWMADRWDSRPDRWKGHDFQYWSPPLRFTADGSILLIENKSSWNLDILTASRPALIHHPYIWPAKPVVETIRIDPCYGTPLNAQGEPLPHVSSPKK
ncbi:MAG: family 43 glycosylhydrolase [Acidobacteriaceae bacterium]